MFESVTILTEIIMHLVYPSPPPPLPKKKMYMTIVSNFPWVLQWSQEKLRTMVMQTYGLGGNVEYGQNELG